MYAALQEQKMQNLPWYKNIESLLKIDDIFNKDHVTAYRLQYYKFHDHYAVRVYYPNLKPGKILLVKNFLEIYIFVVNCFRFMKK